MKTRLESAELKTVDFFVKLGMKIIVRGFVEFFNAFQLSSAPLSDVHLNQTT